LLVDELTVIAATAATRREGKSAAVWFDRFFDPAVGILAKKPDF
jgi:hypothetical protein